MNSKPTLKPQRPYFGAGPCVKNPYWTLDQLSNAPVGRSHRSIIGKERLRLAIEKTRDVLEIPGDYLIGILPGSATGAIECALWNVLGPKPVDVLAFDAFGKLWLHDIVRELRLQSVRTYEADYGHVPTHYFAEYQPNHDVVFTVNGTTSGTWINHFEWIDDARTGLVIADATSAAGCMVLPWSKLDITCFSWQKAFGGEGGSGMMVLSPRAVERLNTFRPSWPIPRLLRLQKNGALNEAIFRGETINTPSLLTVEDYLIALAWAESLGGIQALAAKTATNFAIMEAWVNQTPGVTWLAKEVSYCSPIAACFTFEELADLPQDAQRDKLRQMALLLSHENAAFDIMNHLLAPPSLRVWCGPTVEEQDLAALLPWLCWARSRL